MTRYEDQLIDIERRIQAQRAGRKAQLHPSEVAHLEAQRERERLREELTRTLGPVIKCRWVEPPKKWEIATAEVEIGGNSDLYTVDPWQEIEGKQKLRQEIVRQGYEKTVEAWALWKWHIARGSEVDENDQFILDCQPPSFEWVEPLKPEPKKVGRPKKEEAA